MAVLRLKSLPWAFLVGYSIFMTQPMPSTLSSPPGSPFTEHEYNLFFSALKPAWKARIICQIRRSKGCEDPRIEQLDQYENHGQIPEGPICANLPQTPPFENFCQFAQFRCLNQKFYTKRILCSELPPAEEISVPEKTSHFQGPITTTTKRPETFIVKAAAPIQEDTMLPKQASPSPLDNRLRSNIDSILKYSFAVSGQEPVPREPKLAPQGHWGMFQTPPQEVVPIPLTPTSETEIQTTETTEGQEDQNLRENIQRLIGTALEQTQDEKSTQAPSTRRTDLNVQPTIPETRESKGSLLALEKDEALVVLCYAVLQSICISSAVSKAWRKMEAENFGFGHTVCDSLGRRHADLCSECAFCSLKTEQCKGVSNLKRVNCEGGTFTNYINSEILAQHRAVGAMVVPAKKESNDRMAANDKQWPDDVCGRLATHGCDDDHVALWLWKEYSHFEGGDLPGQICDSTKVVHPNYCAFKSHQCLLYSLSGRKVLRRPCQKNVAYHMLSKKDGEKEVLFWKKTFLTKSEGKGDQHKGAAVAGTMWEAKKWRRYYHYS
ncbi:acrosin-binding protein isoform X2 [Hemicordylus capensis]|uniref:acrosin-binding protein isoform X2 n=1 Tax=Hemicordylus capensis TaxID=884348 RepID=UPI002304BBD5|nr:acrosin-binding protein isoform X2 [Hemicordylus capensis]